MEQFDDIWELADQFENMHNLICAGICEMLVQADLYLEDWFVLLYLIANVGARFLLYYINLEKQLRLRRQIDWTPAPP